MTSDFDQQLYDAIVDKCSDKEKHSSYREGWCDAADIAAQLAASRPQVTVTDDAFYACPNCTSTAFQCICGATVENIYTPAPVPPVVPEIVIPAGWDIAHMEPVEGGQYHVKIFSDERTGNKPGCYSRRSGYGPTWQEALQAACAAIADAEREGAE